MQISTITNAPFIQNSNQMTSSVERIFLTPAIFKAMSKIFSSHGCSDDKNGLDFSSIFFKICGVCSLILLWLWKRKATSWLKRDSGMISVDQTQFFAIHSNQWDCFILYTNSQLITPDGFFSFLYLVAYCLKKRKLLCYLFEWVSERVS